MADALTRRFGPHIDPPLALIPHILSARGLSVYQPTLRNPTRLAKEGIPDEDDQEAFRSSSTGMWGIAHASMLTNLASLDPRLRNASASTLAGDANLAASLGLAGVCFHVGYQKGYDSRLDALDAVARKLGDVVDKLKPGARVLLENGAEGTELGQTVGELAHVVKALGAGPEHIGIVLDSCHLHVTGFDMADAAAPDRLAQQLEDAGLAECLTALHLNDAQFACGSKRDRHAPPGEGTIGEGLRRLVAHPLFAETPCILEMGMEAAERGIAWLEAAA
jgi:deoxyribonuclease-4